MIYKQLKELVKSVDIKNTDAEITRVIGVSITKNFIPSVANLNGVDLTKYNLITKNQFACKLMSVGRDLQLPIDLYKENNYALISSAYYVFEVLDENIILPDYLNMWFRRSETDRWVGYISGGDVRGGISWNMFLEMKVNVPSINEQRQIVAHYQSIANKIKVNEQICEKLEATAQALYKHWFVDFEFPVSHCEERGTSDEAIPALVAEERSLYATAQKGYKSSGEKKVWNEELGKEIPEGWEVGNLSDLITVKYGKDYKHLKKGKIPLYGSGGIMNYVDEVLYDGPSVLIPRKGSLNNILYVKSPFWSVDTMFYSIPKLDNVLNYTFNILSKLDFNSLNVGSAVPSMTTEYLNSMIVLLPKKEVLFYFENEINRIEDYKISISTQIQKLTQLQSLLLSRLAVWEEVNA